jgi:hypothetical protein
LSLNAQNQTEIKTNTDSKSDMSLKKRSQRTFKTQQLLIQSTSNLNQQRVEQQQILSYSCMFKNRLSIDKKYFF